MDNPLTLIPAKVRLVIYLALFIAALVLTSVTSYFTTIHQAVPEFITGLSGAIVAPTAVFAGIAAANTTKPAIPGKALVADEPVDAPAADAGHVATVTAVSLFALGVMVLVAAYMMTHDASAPQAILGKTILGKA